MARNLYPGYCYKCGKYVEPGLGYFERTKKRTGGSKWRVQCYECCNGCKPDKNENIVLRAKKGER